MNIEDNTILITGGSKGIGLEMARQFLQRNNKVIITGRNEQDLRTAEEQLVGITAIQSDVSDPDEIEKLYNRVVKDFPDLNILINNAGVMETINLQDNNYSAKELTAEIDVNLKGTIWMNNVFVPFLKHNNNSAIINLSSGLAFVPLAIAPVYCATKAAIHSYSLSLRAQLKNTSIKVFELAPPLTGTAMIDAFDKEDMKGIAIVPASATVTAFLKGLSKDEYEIRPGLANQLKFMSRFFPNFILKQLSKSVDRMHSG
ncbi:MAG: putative oxidoreductase [Planctomycetota bacterium]|jgi:uncharacterized oxidoreductase